MKLLTPSGRWGYRRRILLDLVVLLAAGALLWGGAGFPLPRGMTFRAMERQRLLEPSEVVLETEVSGGWPVTVGLTDNRIHAAATTLDRFYSWDRTGEPQLILLPSEPSETIALAAVDVPEGTVSARLDLTLCLRDAGKWNPAGLSLHYTVEGVRTGGGFLFTPEPQADTADSDLAQTEDFLLDYGYYAYLYRDLPPYTLTFYDADGAVLAVCETP